MRSRGVKLVASDAQGNVLGERSLSQQGLRGAIGVDYLTVCNECFGELAESVRIVAKLEDLAGEPAWIEFKRDPKSRLWGNHFQSLRLEPDYGGASLWDYSGACSSIEERGILYGQERMAEMLAERIDFWQSHFETRVDDEAHSNARLAFEWSSFQSHGAALCLVSERIMRLPMHLGTPWELRSDSGERIVRDWWFPCWEAENELEREACLALSALDELRFMDLVGLGASQHVGAPMPWAVFCAHMGLSKALSFCLESRGLAAGQVCKWACDPLGAAVFSFEADCARIALAHGASGSGWKTAPIERVVDSAGLVEDKAVENMVSVLASGGESLDVSGMLNRRLGHAQSRALAWVEKADLERSARLAGIAEATARSCSSRI